MSFEYILLMKRIFLLGLIIRVYEYAKCLAFQFSSFKNGKTAFVSLHQQKFLIDCSSRKTSHDSYFFSNNSELR